MSLEAKVVPETFGTFRLLSTDQHKMLNRAVRRGDRYTYISILKANGPWQKIPVEDRTLHLNTGQYVLVPGAEAPVLTAYGVDTTCVYDICYGPDGSVLFGVGNQKPKILAWLKKENFYNEWPD